MASGSPTTDERANRRAARRRQVRRRRVFALSGVATLVVLGGLVVVQAIGGDQPARAASAATGTPTMPIRPTPSATRKPAATTTPVRDRVGSGKAVTLAF